MARPLDISDIQPVRALLPSPPPRAFPAPGSLPMVQSWEQQLGSLSPGLCLHHGARQHLLLVLAAWDCFACRRKGAIFWSVCLHVLVKDGSAAGKGMPEATADQKGATWPCAVDPQ